MGKLSIKLKKKEIDPECMKEINKIAELLELYDPRFEENDQCSGYYAFVSLCFIKEPLGNCPNKYELNISTPYNGTRPDVYLITKLHQNIREQVWNAAKHIQNKYFLHNLKTQNHE